jgi:hypothetical protein
MRRITSFFLVAVLLFAIALALPLFSLPKGHGSKGYVQNTAFRLKYAISTYYTEYREFPIPGPDNDLTLESSHSLMDTLLGSDKEKGPEGRNRRAITFYTDQAAIPGAATSASVMIPISTTKSKIPNPPGPSSPNPSSSGLPERMAISRGGRTM